LPFDLIGRLFYQFSSLSPADIAKRFKPGPVTQGGSDIPTAATAQRIAESATKNQKCHASPSLK
jgi:hypothetical protein